MTDKIGEKSDFFCHPEGQSIILDSIADGVFTVDRNWRITSFNRAAEEITGVSRDEAIGQPVSYTHLTLPTIYSV